MKREMKMGEKDDSPVRAIRQPQCYRCHVPISEKGYCKACMQAIGQELTDTLARIRAGAPEDLVPF